MIRAPEGARDLQLYAGFPTGHVLLPGLFVFQKLCGLTAVSYYIITVISSLKSLTCKEGRPYDCLIRGNQRERRVDFQFSHQNPRKTTPFEEWFCVGFL